jgi:hypothetical protein
MIISKASPAINYKAFFCQDLGLGLGGDPKGFWLRHTVGVPPALPPSLKLPPSSISDYGGQESYKGQELWRTGRQ